jgi:hypothetical protein
MKQDLDTNSWELEEPCIPARSRLFSLKPLHLGTGQVESLTSYMSRLAQAHCVRPGDLISTEMCCFLNAGGSKSYLHSMSRRTEALNGLGEMALNFLYTLEAFTLRDDLASLSLLPWSFALTARGLMRRSKAWCPICYEVAKHQRVVCDPLIWSIDAIKICHIHRQKLSTHCSFCGKQNPQLSRNSLPGHCVKCGEWLGKAQPQSLMSEVDRDHMQQNVWIAQQVEDLLASSCHAVEQQHLSSISKAISLCVSQKADGNIAAFARMLNMPKNTVWGWCKGKVLPELTALLTVCHVVDMSLSQLLLRPEEILIATQSAHNSSISSMPSHQQRASSEFDESALKQLLTETLKDNPPSSMQSVARRLRIPTRTLRRRFPKICKNISLRYCNYRESLKAENIEAVCAEVHSVASQLYQEGLEPTRSRIAKRLSKPAYFREPAVADALEGARQELGLKHL